MPELTADDVAKSVVSGNGEEIGTVTGVEDGTAYVDPADYIPGQLKTKLDWGGRTKDSYPLRNDAIAEVTDGEIRLQADYAAESAG